jgi:hypothetical protein
VSQTGAKTAPGPEDRAYFFGDAFAEEDAQTSGVFSTKIPVVAFEGDYVSSSTTELIIPHPTELPTPQDYINHLLDVREPIGTTGYTAWKRITPVLFKDPDRNGDGQIDVADLVLRVN